MTEDSQLVRFPGATDPGVEDLVHVVQPAPGPCQHLSVELDTDARRVYCQRCKAEVDPFTYILTLKDNWERTRKERIRMEAIATELIIHAPGTDAHTLCHSDSDRKEYAVRITNLIRDVTCLRCRKKLAAQGHANPFWDERVMRDGSTRTGRQLREQRREEYHPACGGYHPKDRCPAASEESKSEAGGLR